MLFFNDLQGSAGNEEFRTLRSRLFQMREQRPLRKVLVTSPLPDEGKSFVAANLAQVIACQKERRVLLIDADLRRHHLHEALGTFPTPDFPTIFWVKRTKSRSCSGGRSPICFSSLPANRFQIPPN